MEQFSIKKAVAIFDMPECCKGCPIAVLNSMGTAYVCPLTQEVSNLENAMYVRGEQCPLKTMEIKIDI